MTSGTRIVPFCIQFISNIWIWKRARESQWWQIEKSNPGFWTHSIESIPYLIVLRKCKKFKRMHIGRLGFELGVCGHDMLKILYLYIFDWIFVLKIFQYCAKVVLNPYLLFSKSGSIRNIALFLLNFSHIILWKIRQLYIQKIARYF